MQQYTHLAAQRNRQLAKDRMHDSESINAHLTTQLNKQCHAYAEQQSDDNAASASLLCYLDDFQTQIP